MQETQSSTSQSAIPQISIPPPSQDDKFSSGKKSMKKLVLILLITFVFGVVLIYSVFSFLRPYLTFLPGGDKLISQVKESTFLSADDIKQLHEIVDSVTSLSDFETTYYDKYASLLENKGLSSLNTPEILTTPTQASINGVDPLAAMNPTYLAETDLTKLKTFAHIFTDEISKYPIEFLGKFQPFGYVFVKKLAIKSGDFAGGLTTQFIVYSLDYKTQNYARMLIHHELSHAIDRLYFPLLHYDQNWPEKNEQYTQTYRLSDSGNLIEHANLGFVDNYALTNAGEDKAETYSYLMTKEGYQKLMGWSESDPALKTKVDYLKAFLKSKVPKLDDSYFETKVLKGV